MRVISVELLNHMIDEGKLRKNGCFIKGVDDIITPSAREFMAENGIICAEGTASETSTIYGIPVVEKPEHLTHLHDGLLVPKNHPRIRVRGQLDSLESKIILLQLCAEQECMPKLVEDLQEIISLIRRMIQCEVKNTPLGDFTLQGLDTAAIREHSHHPGKHYGMRHFLPTYKHGRIVCELNALRTFTREVEITAFYAFENQYHALDRVDIITALNRLSSMFFVMMFKVLTDKYK